MTKRRRRPRQVSSDQVQDEQVQDEQVLSGGVFRRLAASAGSVGTSFSVFEEIYGPTKHEARIEVEAQRRIGKPAPAPADPPDLQPADGDPAGSRFSSRIVIQTQPPADSSAD